MKTKTLRILIPTALLLIIAIGFATQGGIGTFAAFGWQDISLLCPLGSLSAMLASKTLIPRAVISIVIAVVLIVLLGRAFCAWACPVPIVAKLRDAFSKSPKKSSFEVNSTETLEGRTEAATVAPLTKEELDSLKGCAAGKDGTTKKRCMTCAEKRAKLDSRHFALGGALASAAIFGFPVFCLICPIGLTFASILLIMRLFSEGDVTWAVVVVPALLLIEIVFFRKWCSRICPLSAIMSLLGKFNKTFVPVIDEHVCLETARDATCERCTAACPEGINLRHPELGNSLSECTRCNACVEACPGNAISLPLLAKVGSKKDSE